MSLSKQETQVIDGAKAYIEGFSDSSNDLISNCETHISTFTTESGDTLPVTINNTEYQNSYVCSLYTALIPYCLEELHKLKSPILRRFFGLFIPLLEKKLKFLLRQGF